MISEDVLTRLEALHPEVISEMRTVLQLAHDTTDPALLELCAGYIDAALNNRLWQPPHELTEKEKAFIAFTEQFVTSVSTMQDVQVQRLLEHASADEVYAFVNALYVTDMTSRLDIVAGRMVA